MWRRPRRDEMQLVIQVALFALFLIIVFRVGYATAQEVVTKLDTDPGSFAEDLYTAFTAKEWGIFVGCLIMLVVWGTRLFVLPRMSSDWLPHISSGMGVLLAISIDLTSKVPWWKAILNGLLVGAAASGLWSQVGKKFLPTERKKKENIEVEEQKPVDVHEAPTSPKIIVVKDIVHADSTLDNTAVMSEEQVRKLLDEEDTEPDRKASTDDTKPSH